MRGLLVVCDTPTTHLSLRLDPRVLLYHNPPTLRSNLATPLGRVRSDELHSTLDACPYHSPAVAFFRPDVRDENPSQLYLLRPRRLLYAHWHTERDGSCGVSQGRVFGGRCHQWLSRLASKLMPVRCRQNHPDGMVASHLTRSDLW